MNLESSFANHRKTGITIGMKNGLIAFSSLSEKTTHLFSVRFGGAEASQFCGYSSERWASVHYILCLSSIQGCLTSAIRPALPKRFSSRTPAITMRQLSSRQSANRNDSSKTSHGSFGEALESYLSIPRVTPVGIVTRFSRAS